VSGILGIIHLEGAPVKPADLELMAGEMAHRGPDGMKLWQEGAAGMGQLMLCTTPESVGEVLPWHDSSSGLVITADARLDNRDDLLRKLHIADSNTADSQLLLSSYQQWGESCVDHLVGDFAFAIYDSKRRELFFARDHLGLRPFNYHQSGPLLVFASSARAIAALSAIPSRLDEGRVADYLIPELEGINKTCTFFEQVNRLPPAHCGTFKNNSLTIRRYWSPDVHRELRLSSDNDYVDALQEVLSKAVIDRLRCNGQAASMLSGGVDSSTVVGIARDYLKRSGCPEFRTFSAVSDTPGSLETKFISQVVEQGDVQAVLIGTEQMESQRLRLEQVFSRLEDPFDGFMVMQMMLNLTASENGNCVLLDGVDGDIVASLSQYYPAWLLNQRDWRLAFRETNESWRNFRLAQEPRYRTFWEMLVFFVISGINRTGPYRRYAGWRTAHRLNRSLLSESFAKRALVLARQLEFQEHCKYNLPAGLRASHAVRLDSAYMTAGIERYGRVAAVCGVENRSPLLDKRVVEFCLAMPWQQKVRNGWSKYALRELAKRVVPSTVALRNDYDHLGWNFTRKMMALRKPEFQRVFNGSENPLSGYLRRAKYEALKEEVCLPCTTDGSADLWRAVNLGIWLEQLAQPCKS
jgi:asparagine synthase (glutamine-hydrolysing)